MMAKHKEKIYQKQLGMGVGKATHKLKRDLIFYLIPENKCFHCGLPMTRENFSIEHKIPWVHDENAYDLFFDLNNISFSHLKCNVGARRKQKLKPCGTHASWVRGCRCEECTKAKEKYRRVSPENPYDPIKRRQKYLKYGK